MKAAIIGAGFGGMAAAYDLARAGWQVTIFEAAEQVGGLAAGFRDPGWDWSVEHFYHHWFASDKHMLGLIEELGWSEEVIFPRPLTVVLHEEAFYPLDSPLNALRFPGFNLVDIARFGLATLYLRLTPYWQPLEKQGAAAWLRRWYGNRLYRVLWEPLLVGKFGPYAEEVNAAWFWARAHARTTRLGTFKGGFQAFAEAFAAHLQKIGVDLQLQTPVAGIRQAASGGLMLRAGEVERHFDHCLVTTSPAILARIAPELPPAYLEQLLALKSMGAVVMVLALKQPLSTQGHYWHNLPKSAGFPFLALVEHTHFVSPEHFGGEHIVYCGDYLIPEHEYFSLSKAQLLERFMPALVRVNPDFKPDWVRESWLFRSHYAQPVPPTNHSQNIPEIETPIAGLWLASMSQVYPWDRGTNFAVEIARRAARKMLAV